jgi:hypothetical protein
MKMGNVYGSNISYDAGDGKQKVKAVSKMAFIVFIIQKTG